MGGRDGEAHPLGVFATMHLEPTRNGSEDPPDRKEVKARIPADTRERLARLKEETGKTFTDAVTEALERYFDSWNEDRQDT